MAREGSKKKNTSSLLDINFVYMGVYFIYGYVIYIWIYNIYVNIYINVCKWQLIRPPCYVIV